MESKRKRCALVSGGARSLIATTVMSLRLASTMARNTLRPMRPNPLMATRSDIFTFSLRRGLMACFRAGIHRPSCILFKGMLRRHKPGGGADFVAPQHVLWLETEFAAIEARARRDRKLPRVTALPSPRAFAHSVAVSLS